MKKIPVSYRDIPKQERTRFVETAYHQKPRLRVVRFAAFLVPMMFSGLLTDLVVSKAGPFLLRLGFHILFAVGLCVIVWEIFGRPRLHAEVEKLKNA